MFQGQELYAITNFSEVPLKLRIESIMREKYVSGSGAMSHCEFAKNTTEAVNQKW
jgi:hypothetical protein